jgi:Domain of unknown function (DUF4411)
VSKTTYSFDTSALIDWWVRHYSPDILPSLKTNVETVIAEGRFKASRYVLTELEQGGDELHEWAKLHKDDIFVEDDEAAQQIARSLIQTYSFPENSKKGLTGADPFVIARAQLGNPVWTVVSGEKASDANNPKIPYVCGQLDVPCLTFRQFWQNEGWSF